MLSQAMLGCLQVIRAMLLATVEWFLENKINSQAFSNQAERKASGIVRKECNIAVL